MSRMINSLASIPHKYRFLAGKVFGLKKQVRAAEHQRLYLAKKYVNLRSCEERMLVYWYRLRDYAPCRTARNTQLNWTGNSQ